MNYKYLTRIVGWGLTAISAHFITEKLFGEGSVKKGLSVIFDGFSSCVTGTVETFVVVKDFASAQVTKAYSHKEVAEAIKWVSEKFVAKELAIRSDSSGLANANAKDKETKEVSDVLMTKVCVQECLEDSMISYAGDNPDTLLGDCSIVCSNEYAG